MKTIWLSALHKDEAGVQKLIAQMKRYGLEVKGHFWPNDNKKLAWAEALDEVLAHDCAMWAIAGNQEDFKNRDFRYGLSMLALCIQAKKGAGFPIVVLQNGGSLPDSDHLTTPFAHSDIFDTANSGVFAKLVAKVHAPTSQLPSDYYINMTGNSQLGQWFEIRPAGEAWPGIIFGIDQGDILFQAVGPAGGLPDKSTLKYAMQGLRIELDSQTYNAWGVRNTISKEQAYYVKIDGTPASLLFGPFSEEAKTEMYTFSVI
ncbi:MAG: hypothetical protein GY874_18315 [Desulfobacteraceae bacterium]|nr:hypothetical protein [Desulfobacteraceae bacterium]